MRRSGFAIAVLAVLAACGPGRVVRKGQIDMTTLGTIQHTVEQVRGLRFTAPVAAHVLDAAGLRKVIEDDLAHEYRPGDLERLAAVYARLGLVPPGTDLGAAVTELYSDEIAALYDPRTKALSLAAGALRQAPFSIRVLEIVSGRDLIGELALAHELTHALQDQHFGLPTTTPPITDAHGDRTLARQALVEGDATLASAAYAAGGPIPRKAVLSMIEEVASLPEMLAERHPNVPDVLRASVAFSYNQGTALAAGAYLRGAWPAVDAAYGDPPTSSEQLLHLDKYFAARDQPVLVTLGGTEALERQGWTRVVEDTLGELDVRVLVRSKLPERAPVAAAGWGGDRLRAYQRDREIAIVWLTTWDTEDDAVEFADVAGTVVADAVVERRGERVLILVGPDAGALGPAVWSRSRCVRASPPVPPAARDAAA